MLNWVIIDEEYLDYLRNNADRRIPHSDYGKNKYKPFFGVLFEIGDLAYVTQISHAQPRHMKMKNSIDFRKIYLPGKRPGEPDRLAAVVNLNYMFPVPKTILKNLEYKDIDQHRTFTSLKQKSEYIDLLRKELAAINTLGIENLAQRLYALKNEHPENFAAQRCLDFKMLEEFAHQYK